MPRATGARSKGNKDRRKDLNAGSYQLSGFQAVIDRAVKSGPVKVFSKEEIERYNKGYCKEDEDN